MATAALSALLTREQSNSHALTDVAIACQALMIPTLLYFRLNLDFHRSQDS